MMSAYIQTCSKACAGRMSRFEQKLNGVASTVYHKSGMHWVGQKAQNNPVGRALFYGANYDVHDVTNEAHKDYDASVVKIWENAEVFDWRTERLFRYIQVCSSWELTVVYQLNETACQGMALHAVWQIETILDSASTTGI